MMNALWQSLGNVQGVDTLEEALEVANLTWEVELRPIFFERELTGGEMTDYDEDEGFSYDAIASHNAVIRMDTQHPLGVVGSRYTPIQIREALSILEGISGSDADLEYHSAGTFYGGARVWMLFQINGMALDPCGGDEMLPYILVSTAHDGSKATRCNFMLRREATGGICILNRGVAIRHTASAQSKLERAQEVFDLAVNQFEHFEQAAAGLADTKMTDEEWRDFLDEIAPPPDPDMKRPGKAIKKRDTLTDLFHNGVQAKKAVERTRWAAYNAVMTYASDHANYRGGVDGKLNSLWFGSGNALTQKAFDLLGDV